MPSGDDKAKKEVVWQKAVVVIKSVIKAAGGIAGALLIIGLTVSAGPAVRNGSTHEETNVATDIPATLRVRNDVGTDGGGLCVWASAEMMARYLNTPGLQGVFEALKREPGGGWPERVDREMAKRAPRVQYKQYVGADLDFIRKGIASGRPVCATYGYGEFYGNRTIAHMVLVVYLDDKKAAILDNNDPTHIWWMSAAEYSARFNWPNGTGWAWYVLGPPPPPVPHN